MAGKYKELLVSFWRAVPRKHRQLQWPPLRALQACIPVMISCFYKPPSVHITCIAAASLWSWSFQSASWELEMIYSRSTVSAWNPSQQCYQVYLGSHAHFLMISCWFSFALDGYMSGGLAGSHNHLGSNLCCLGHSSKLLSPPEQEHSYQHYWRGPNMEK